MISNKTIMQAVILLASTVYLIFSPVSLTYAGTIVVKPGQFDHFTIQLPERAVAGENFLIKVQAYDANNNLITNFTETGKEFRVEASGSATVQPSALGARSFSGGSANILLNDKKAEKVMFSIRESGGSVPVISREIEVIPNKLDHFALQAQAEARAGSPFDVKVVALDRFDNLVRDLDIGRNIKILSAGTSEIRMTGSSPIDFASGSATLSLFAEKTGDVIVEIQELTSGSSGRTRSIQINPAPLSYFKLQAQKDAVAGEPFEILIAAYDEFDNLVTNYTSSGAGIKLVSTGSSKVEPSSVSAAGFKNGQAIVNAVYEKSETIQVIARENNREQSGKTNDIRIANAPADHFVVVTPETAQAGQPFMLKVEAYDRFNNIAKDFNIAGNDVALFVSGNGTLSPARISTAQFKNGVAIVEAAYDRAESFQITASMTSEKGAARMVTRDIEKTKPVTRKETPPTAAKPRITAPSKKPEQKQAQPATQTAQLPRQTQQKPAQAPPQKAAPAIEPEKEAKAVIPTPAPEQPKAHEKIPSLPGALIYDISNISIIEAKEKSMLVINVTNPNGELQYSDEIESKYGKEWLKLKISPAINKTGQSFKFQSYFIGDVLVEDSPDMKNTVFILVELVPSGLTYDLARVKNNLIITFAKP